MALHPRFPTREPLPRGESPAVAAGYAMAGAALVAALLFVVVSGALATIDYLQTAPEYRAIGFAFLFPLLGLVAAVLVAPSAFVAGVAAWRWVVPADGSRRRGAVGGVVAVLGTYLLAGLLVSILGVVVVFVDNVNSALFFDRWLLSALVSGLADGAAAGPIALFYGFRLTFWIAIPVGAVVGWRLQRRE